MGKTKPGCLIPCLKPLEIGEPPTCMRLKEKLEGALTLLKNLLNEHKQDIQNLICSGNSDWALQLKRFKIYMPPSHGTVITAKHIDLNELINQCSNLRRMCDALKWFSENFKDAVVVVCHPTQTDNPKDNDLVLTNEGIWIHVEVTDTCGSAYKRKLKK